ncbi:MAG: hypothetical protein IJ877_02370 [Candidatus Gastranaerophilales bacterium]|nr:hypothetical protein [Candidatus Gastranaerophilales bacterium]
MNIQPVGYNNYRPSMKKSAPSFGKVHELAAKQYLTSNEFAKNKDSELNRFTNFLREQSKNETYHIIPKYGRYIICREGGHYKKVEESTAEINDYKMYLPVGVDAEDVTVIKEFTNFASDVALAMSEMNGFQTSFDDIYKAGEVCNQLEKIRTQDMKRVAQEALKNSPNGKPQKPTKGQILSKAIEQYCI